MLRTAQLSGHFTEQTLTVGPKGLEHSFEDGRKVFCPWRTVLKIGKTHGYLAFVVDPNDNAWIVPLHAFESELRANLFLAAAVRWHRNETGSEGQVS